MTTINIQPANQVYTSDYASAVCNPRVAKGKKALYAAFSFGVPTIIFDAFPLPSWDSSGFFQDSILDAIKEKMIEARKLGLTTVELPKLPEFLASLSTSGRISKDDLTAWLLAIRPFIDAYVLSRSPDDTPAQVAAKGNKLTDWASKAAAPNPAWSEPAWESLSRLAAFLETLAEEAEADEFPSPKMLEAFVTKVAAMKAKPIVDDAI